MIPSAASDPVTNVLDWLAQGPESHLDKRRSPLGLRSGYASAHPAPVPAAIRLPQEEEVPNRFSRTQSVDRNRPMKVKCIYWWCGLQTYGMAVEGLLS